MLTAVLIFVLVVANVAVFVSILRAQRITTPKCGGCSSPVVDPLTESCPSCGRGYIDVGIAAGSVMRPPTRRFLCLGGVIVVLAVFPFLVQRVDGLLEQLKEIGEWRSSSNARFYLDTGDVQDPRNVFAESVRILDEENGTVIEAWFEVRALRGDEHEIGPPLRHVFLERGGSIASLDPVVPFAVEDYGAWLQDTGILNEQERDQTKINSAVAFMDEEIRQTVLQLQQRMDASSEFRPGVFRGWTWTRGLDEPMPLAAWQATAIWVGTGIVAVIALWLVVVLILRATRSQAVSACP